MLNCCQSLSTSSLLSAQEPVEAKLAQAAVAEIEARAHAHDPIAQCYLAALLDRGNLAIAKDVEAAASWYHKAAGRALECC